jgi:nitrate reductase molybdenum cofactor assembly chaperone
MAERLAICSDLADLIEYPGPELRARTDECIARLEPRDPAAAKLLREFRRQLEGMRDGPLQEAYTAAFDMQKDRCLYVGHHLFGEDCRRNLFLSLLNEHYQARGFASGNELPDYLPAMLRFASRHEGDTETAELISECMVPALRKMAASGGLYSLPLRAVLELLAGEGA